jgi:hypothetical protein
VPTQQKYGPEYNPQYHQKTKQNKNIVLEFVAYRRELINLENKGFFRYTKSMNHEKNWTP